MISRDLLAPVLATLVVAVTACARAPESKGTDSTSAPVDSASPRPAITAQPAVASRLPDSGPGSAPPAPTPARAEPTPTPSPAPTVTPSETVLTGRVVAGGVAAQPVTSLQVEGGKPMLLVGPLEQELRTLGGATVWVAGTPGAVAPNASFAVSRYEIVSIDGVKPLVGSLVARNGGTWLATERDTVKLALVPAALDGKTGAKVWIVGRRSGTELTPQTFGVIREP